MVEQKIELPKEAAILSHFSACSEEPEAEKKVKILKALPGVQDLFNVVDDMARVHGPDSRSVRAALAELDRAVAR